MRSKKLVLIRDERLEKDLHDQGLSFVFADVPVDKVDESSTTYQTRKNISGESKDVASDYKEHIDNGEKFPSMLFIESEDGSYAVCCGKHRLKAAKDCKIKTLVGAMVVKLTQKESEDGIFCEKLRVISRFDNARNGWRISRNEIYDDVAADIIRENGGADCGIPSRTLIRQVCKRNKLGTQVPEGVTKRVSSILVQSECRDMGIVPPAELSACHELLQLRYLESFPSIAKASAKFDGKGLASILSEIRLRKMNTSEALAHIQNASDGYVTKKVKKMSAVDSFRLQTGKIMQVLIAIKADSSLKKKDASAFELQAEKLLAGIAETMDAIKRESKKC